jgi:hypothetical protein
MEMDFQMLDIGEVFDYLCPEFTPGRQFMDLLSEWVKFNDKSLGIKSEDYTDMLDKAVNQAC